VTLNDATATLNSQLIGGTGTNNLFVLAGMIGNLKTQGF